MVWSPSWAALNFKFSARGRQVSISLRSKLRQTGAWLDGSETYKPGNHHNSGRFVFYYKNGGLVVMPL